MPTESAVFNSLDALQAFLARLAPPAPGFRRVFRGQNRDFGTMIPSGVRRRTREYWSLWHRHVMLLAPFESDLGKAAAAGKPSTLDMISYWVHAIAQHYGGDSNYLDVTKDLESALWFSLHRMVTKSATITMGVDESLAAEDLDVVQTLIAYEAWTEPAYLYVMDVPEWNGETLQHGSLIDVAQQAPQLVTASTRMAAQKACLVHADAMLEDLSAFYACPPIRVSWPMTGAKRLTVGTDDVFPSPKTDPWYALFLRQPLVLTPDASGHLHFERPVPVAQYFGESTQQVQDLLALATIEQPRLVHMAMRDAMRASHAEPAIMQRLAAANVILCEAALCALLPSPAGKAWHAELLLQDLPDHATAQDFGGGASGTVDVTNVVFEFSPLERIAAQSATRATVTELVRGLWVVRAQGQVLVAPYIQTTDGSGAMLSVLQVIADPEAEFGMAYYAKGNRLPDDACRFLAAPVHAALFTLRSLAAGEKILPFCLAGIDAKSSTGTYVAGVDLATTTLHRLPDQVGESSVYVLRQEGEVFFGPGRQSTRQFLLPAGRLFGQITVEELRHHSAVDG